jgi:ribosome maturation factor RimP
VGVFVTALSHSVLVDLTSPILVKHNLDLEEIEIRKTGNRQVVKVIIDKITGITLDDIALVTKQLSDKLDELNEITTPYTLEVTSPGVDRPLTERRHWQKNLNRLVKVDLQDGRSLVGRISVIGDQQVTLIIKDKPIDLKFDQINRAVVQVEFNR